MKLLKGYEIKAYKYDGTRYKLVKTIKCSTAEDKEFQLKYLETQNYDIVVAEVDEQDSRTILHYV